MRTGVAPGAGRRGAAATPGAASARLALLLLLLVACSNAEAGSLLLVTLDTTRVDHLSCYGYERNTTPHLDALARRAVLFRRAWSTSSWTLPAHASLFTGLYPSRHGAHYDPAGDAVLGDVLRFRSADQVRAGRLPEERITLAELLSERGYRTAAFVGGPWLHRSFGLLQGFEVRDDGVEGYGGRPARELTDRALAWLTALPEQTPYFLFVNYFDPHAPYSPREAHADLPLAAEPFEPRYEALMRGEARLSGRERAVLRDRYDAEIREMDTQLGRLLDAVLRRPGGERTLVVVTGDHGEALGEDGRFGHGFWLSEELVRVPLIIRHARDREGGTSSDATVQLVDVLPLVARELGLELPAKVEGVLPGKRSVALAELYREPSTVTRFGSRYDRDLRVAIGWPYKLEREDDGTERWLRIADDELAATLEAGSAHQRRALVAALEAHDALGQVETVRPEVDADTMEALRELGYVE